MRALLKFTLISALISLLPNSLNAEFEFTGWFSAGWPQGSLKDYGYSANIKGGTGRLSWGVGDKSSFQPFFFTEFSYIDFIVEKGFIPIDPYRSKIDLDTATDFYLMMFRPGVSLGKRSGDFRPYCDFFGGLIYYSSLSRIASKYRLDTPVHLLMEQNGTIWHAGIGGGIKIMLWRSKPSSKKSWLDEFCFNVKAEYTKGGKAEYLNWHSARYDAETISYDNFRSNIDIFLLSYGLSLVF